MAVDYSRLILAPKATNKLAQPKDKEHLFHPYVDLPPRTLRFLFSNTEIDPLGATAPNGFYNEKAKMYIRAKLTELYRPLALYLFMTSPESADMWNSRYEPFIPLEIYELITTESTRTKYDTAYYETLYAEKPYSKVNVTGLYAYKGGLERDWEAFKGKITENINSELAKAKKDFLNEIIKVIIELHITSTNLTNLVPEVLETEVAWDNDYSSQGAKPTSILLGTWKKVDDGTNRNVWDWTYDPSSNSWGGVFKGMFTHNHNTDVKVIAAGDLSGIDDMAYMFQNCDALSYVCPLDTADVTRFKFMFCDCNNLLRLPELDISNATTLAYFAGRNVMQNYGGSINYESDYTKHSKTIPPSKITNIPLSYSRLPAGCELYCAFKGLDHAVGGFNSIANNLIPLAANCKNWAFGCKKADYSEFTPEEIIQSGVTETFNYNV